MIWVYLNKATDIFVHMKFNEDICLQAALVA